MACTCVWRIALPACLRLRTGSPAGVQILQKVEACSLNRQGFPFPNLEQLPLWLPYHFNCTEELGLNIHVLVQM